jgi:hypothetical protein
LHRLKQTPANEEFEDFVLAIVCNLPLRNPTVLSARAMRRLLQVTDGITSKVFRLLHQLAIEAIKSGAERLSDDAIDQWQPMTPNERLFA